MGTPETSDDPGMIDVAQDFLALGATRWLLRDLAIAMGHEGAINQQALTREVLAGADAWQACDRTTAVNRLRAGFEVLTQARERFYPVDAYLIDLCLLDPAMAGGVLAEPLSTHVAISFVAPGLAIENQASRDPDSMERLRHAINDGWVDVAGGQYAEAENSLLPLESSLWQFRRGGDAYRAHLEERNVETFARRRFGLFTQLPQIAKRFGFRYALHLGFDAGRFPIRSEVKRLWESPDGSSLETLLRPPLAADRPCARVARRLAAGRDHAERPRRHAAPGALAHSGRPLVRRPQARRNLLAGARPLGHAQRLLPSDRPPLRDLPARPRLVRVALPCPGRGHPRPGADLAPGSPPSPACPLRRRRVDPGHRAGHRGRRRVGAECRGGT